jgi:hypothetical protein
MLRGIARSDIAHVRFAKSSFQSVPVGRMVLNETRTTSSPKRSRWRSASRDLVPGVDFPGRRGRLRFVSGTPEENDHEVRGKAERFADHYTQATLFWNRQVDLGKQHIVNAFRFELSRVQTPAVRERMVSGLMNVAAELAETVAAGLGIRDMPAPMPKVLKRDVKPEVSVSPTLSLFARPGDGSNRTRRWQSSWRRGVTASRS